MLQTFNLTNKHVKKCNLALLHRGFPWTPCVAQRVPTAFGTPSNPSLVLGTIEATCGILIELSDAADIIYTLGSYISCLSPASALLNS